MIFVDSMLLIPVAFIAVWGGSKAREISGVKSRKFGTA